MPDSTFLCLLKVLSVVWEIWTIAKLVGPARGAQAWTPRLLAGIFVSHLLGDVFNLASGEYARPKAIGTSAALTAKFLLRFIHVGFITAVASQLNGKLWRVLRSRAYLLGLVLILPFVFRFGGTTLQVRPPLSPWIVANELFLFALFALSFPCALAVLCGSQCLPWCQLGAGIAIAITGAVGKRFEMWAGYAMDAPAYEVLWTFGLLLQGLGAVAIGRDNHPLGDITALSGMATSKTTLLLHTYAAIFALLLLEAPTTHTVMQAAYLASIGATSAIMLTHGHQRMEKYFMQSLSAMLRSRPGNRLPSQDGVAQEYHRALEAMVCQRDAMLQRESMARQRDAYAQAMARMTREMHQRVMHDIRSPLAALQVATTDSFGNTASRAQLAQLAVARIQKLAEQLLRAEPGAADLEPNDVGVAVPRLSVVELGPILACVVEEKRAEWLDRPHIQIEMQAPNCPMPANARADAGALISIVSNLLNNAAESMVSGGRICMSLSQEPDPDGNDACIIRVTDHGRGIPPELLPQLSVEPLSWGKAQGHGLGLYHARRQLALWAGTLKIVSTYGAGTEVSVVLPAARGEGGTSTLPDLITPRACGS